ncbi:sugar transferase [Pantoea sp. B65]|uniref:sugar transferase n=1 Tax=Pantoea sp. B65 TaxID=2813359 RepID=UPI0039B5BEDB
MKNTYIQEDLRCISAIEQVNRYRNSLIVSNGNGALTEKSQINYSVLYSKFVKRLVDFILSAAAIFLLSPVLLYLTVHISLSGGSPIYGHLRIGKNGKPFKCYKFRTMRRDSDKVLKMILRVNSAAAHQWASEFKLKNDPRITRIGRLLRKTSLDELPQLFNVFMGNMSLIGPRPVTAVEISVYGRSKRHYFKCKPGISGLWQVSGRNDVSYSRRIALDTAYAKRRTFFLDIIIMIKTIFVIFGRKGAY